MDGGSVEREARTLDETLDIGRPHLIVKDGEPVGIVAVMPGAAEDRLRDTLSGDGYRLHEAAPSDQETYRLGGECKVEAPQQCTVEIVLGRFEELAEQAGVSSEEVDVLADGEFTGQQARQACAAVLDRMPEGEQKTEAATWYAVAFEDAGRP